jgi:hypothetical protein
VNIVLGFGSTEQEFVKGEEDAIRAFISKRFAAIGLSYFTDAVVADLRRWLSARADELHKLSATYKSGAEFPDRYSYYWPTVLDDASHIVVILKVHHINRRHALSPDGWALMREQPMFLFEALDMADAIKDAA